jgi:hypothetical protein
VSKAHPKEAAPTGSPPDRGMHALHRKDEDGVLQPHSRTIPPLLRRVTEIGAQVRAALEGRVTCPAPALEVGQRQL